MKNLNSLIVLAVIVLITPSCGGIVPLGDNKATGPDSTSTIGSNPVGTANTPGTFRTGIYSQSSLATTATANTTGPSPSPEDLAGNSAGNAGTVSWITKRFMTETVTIRSSEMKLSKLVLSRTQNEKIKNYASALLNSHDDMDKDLKEMAASKKMTLPGPDAADLEKKLSKLASVSDDQFDKEYIKLIMKDHRDAADLFKQGSGVADPAIKAYTGKYLPVIKKQLQELSSLKSELR